MFNYVLKVKGTNHSALYHTKFFVDKPHWICEDKESKLSENNEILDNSFDFKFQNKHNQSPIISLTKKYNSLKKDFEYLVETKLHIRGITPGQVIAITIRFLLKNN